MSLQRCRNCHAVLPDIHKLVTCPYCNLPTGSAHEAPADVLARREDFMRLVYMVVGILFVAVPTLYVFLGRNWFYTPDAKTVVQKGADLHALGADATEVSPIPTSALGPLTAYDPLAQLPWFTALAATWAPDARLARLELHGVRPDGTMDVSIPATDASARYQFASAVRDTAAKQQRKNADSLLWSAINVELKGGVLRAMVVANSNEARPASPVTFDCNVPKLIALWRAKGLPSKGGYDIELADQKGPKADYVWQSHDWGVPKVGMDCRLR